MQATAPYRQHSQPHDHVRDAQNLAEADGDADDLGRNNEQPEERHDEGHGEEKPHHDARRDGLVVGAGYEDAKLLVPWPVLAVGTVAVARAVGTLGTPGLLNRVMAVAVRFTQSLVPSGGSPARVRGTEQRLSHAVIPAERRRRRLRREQVVVQRGTVAQAHDECHEPVREAADLRRNAFEDVRRENDDEEREGEGRRDDDQPAAVAALVHERNREAAPHDEGDLGVVHERMVVGPRDPEAPLDELVCSKKRDASVRPGILHPPSRATHTTAL